MIKNQDANSDYINGMFSFMKGNYDQSIEHLSRAIENDPDHTLALMSRGSAYFRSGRLQDAISDFDRAIELRPNLARSYHLRGLAKERQGNE
ncbi:MAG: tetratricopeptide repeat protein, partial [Desulfobacterales bacterium]